MYINNMPNVSSGIWEITLKVNSILISGLVFCLCGINWIYIREAQTATMERVTWEISVIRGSEWVHRVWTCPYFSDLSLSKFTLAMADHS